MVDNICKIKHAVNTQTPFVHCITNPISINQCANVILSVGAKPIMAEHPKEVCEITAVSDALMLNIGNITDIRMESMVLSAETAKEKHIPVLLDTVGIPCSSLRRKFVQDFLHKFTPSVIKGNYSEINALYDATYVSRGVDADPKVSLDHITNVSGELARKYKTVILATGKTDIITDGNRIVHAKNGTPHLASLTGTGCMLGALTATFMACATPFDAAVSACSYFGICGELSVTDKGCGSFMVSIMDQLSTLSRENIFQYLNTEEFT